MEPRPFQIGILKDQLGTGPDFFEPMDEDELALWEGACDQLASEMNPSNPCSRTLR